MAFDSFQEFLAMGGHAPYVWTVWSVTLALLVASGLHARVEHRHTLNAVKRRLRRERRQAGDTATTHTARGDYAHDTKTQA